MYLNWFLSAVIFFALCSMNIANKTVFVTVNFEGTNVVHQQQCECVLFFQCEDADSEKWSPIAFNNRSVQSNVNCGEFEVCCKPKYTQHTKSPSSTGSEACLCVPLPRCLMDPAAKTSGVGLMDVRLSQCNSQEVCCPLKNITDSVPATTKPPPACVNPDAPKPQTEYVPLDSKCKDMINRAKQLREENDLLKEKLQKFEQRKAGRLCEWIPSSDGNLPAGAFYLGQNRNDDAVYAGRAYHENDLIPAQISPKNKGAYIGYGGVEYKKTDYEVLCNCNEAKWVSINKTEIPSDAIAFGYSYLKDKSYIGRTMYEGKLIFAKIQPYHRGAYILLSGKEYYIDENYKYETLVLN